MISSDLPSSVWSETRAEVARIGWGRGLLDQQDPDGKWGGGLYSPKWTSTTYTLLLLRRLGLEPGNAAALAGCRALVEEATWREGGVSYWSTHNYAERCVNSMILLVLSYFGHDDPRLDGIADLLLRAEYPDGGWNCEDHRGATHPSFHTTVSALEGLTEWKRRSGASDADGAIARGHEFMYAHGMFRSHRTRREIDPEWKVAHFPPRWHYDLWRGLDHLRESGVKPDGRVEEAVHIVSSQRRDDGCWGKGKQYGGKTYFPLEPGRVPSRINTLRALRILRWWET